MSFLRKVLVGFANALVATAILATPRLALACAVCFSGRDDETQLAFRISTGVMTLLPFGLVGGLLLWLRSRYRAIAEEEERVAAQGAQLRSDAVPSPGPPTARPTIR